MKTIRFFAVLFLFGIIPAQAQTQLATTMDSLMAYKWKLVDSDYSSILYETYGETNVISNEVWIDDPGKEDILTYNYYMSTTQNISSFDPSKIGKVKNGRFIVTKQGGKLFIDYIVELTDKKLVLYSIMSGTSTEWRALPKSSE